MPNQRDPNKKLVGGYVSPEIKRQIARLGTEEASAMEMLLIEGLVINGYLTPKEVQKMADKGELRPASVFHLRNRGILTDPVKKAAAA